jgi:hypothetical protein
MGKYSEFKGVTKSHDSWQAQIAKNGRSMYIGTYPTEIAAAKAFNKEAMAIHKDKSYTNPLPGHKDYGKRLVIDARYCNGGCGGFKDVSNRKKTSKFKGVYWNSYFECWKVDIKRHDLRYQCSFEDEVEAAKDYNKAIVGRYGDAAKFLNKIPRGR